MMMSIHSRPPRCCDRTFNQPFLKRYQTTCSRNSQTKDSGCLPDYIGEDSLSHSKSCPAVDLFLSHSRSSHSCSPRLSNKLMTSSLGLQSPTCHCTTGDIGAAAAAWPSFCFLLPRPAINLTHHLWLFLIGAPYSFASLSSDGSQHRQCVLFIAGTSACDKCCLGSEVVTGHTCGDGLTT
jgi:hypothetical protein